MQNWQTLKRLFHEAVDFAPDQRRSFLKSNCADTQIRREVENLCRAFDESNDFILEPAMVEIGLIWEPSEPPNEEIANRIGEKIGNYEIVRELGEGGMGAVYLAARADDEFRQEVALKIVKRGMDTDFIVRRFRRERQILAELNHPHIARLLEGGTTADGLPYFVMERVEGADLISYCDEQNLNLEERLFLFRKVCAAVEYAHQRSVVHRDLKPSNILVTADGTPKLLDFGIAKLLNVDSSSVKTTGVLRMLTPEYASPEQIRGGQITTASDVYSLGVILYQLLSGQRPFQLETDSREEFIQAILNEEPSRPSSVIWDLGFGIWDFKKTAPTKLTGQTTAENKRKTNPQSQIPNPKSLRGDLDNIILKALRKEPARRYVSVEEFSEDIHRYLNGLPVKAQADTFGYRAAKFLKRHRIGVFAAVLILFSLCGGIVAASWQAYRANLERAKAEQRFADVHALSNSLMLEIHDTIKDLPGATPARQLMIERALVFLDKLSVEAENNADLQRDLAVAYEKVGDVQGSPIVSNLGDTSGAFQSYQKALKIRETLAEKNSPTATEKFAVATLHGKIFQVAAFQIEMQTAETHGRQALSIIENLVENEPENNLFRNALANAYSQIGELDKKDKSFERALESFRQTILISEAILEKDSLNADALSNLQLAHTRIGEIYETEKDFPATLSAFQNALDAAKKSASARPNNAAAQIVLGINYGKVGFTQTLLGQHEEALKNSQNGLQILETQVAADPQNTFADRQLACAFKNVGFAFLQNGKPFDSLDYFQKALAIKEKLQKKDVSDVYLVGDIGEIYAYHGNAFEKMAQSKTNLQAKKNDLIFAEKWYQRSLEIWLNLQKENKLPQYYAAKPDELKRMIEQCHSIKSN